MQIRKFEFIVELMCFAKFDSQLFLHHLTMSPQRRCVVFKLNSKETFIDQAVDVVLNAVRSVFQNYVESLKNSGNFNSVTQKIVFNLAKNLVLKWLSE